MDLKIKNKNAVVLGASSGIGRSIALGFAGEGTNVAICARGQEALERTKNELLGHGVKAHAKSCDVSDKQALDLFLDETKEALGSIDILVHNASALAVGPTLEDWDASIRVDLMAGVHACEKVIPWMVANGGGNILLVSSISGIECDPSPDYAYTAAKAALVAYAKKLAVMHATSGIRVNAIAPGSIEFPGGIWAQVKEHEPTLYDSVRASVPCGRLGTPEEVADVAVFIASPRAGWVTGECISVDGAQHKGIR